MSSSKSQTAPGDAVKSKKDDRYDNMLKKIDLSLDKEKSKKPGNDNDANDDNDGFISSSRGKKAGGVSLMDLVSNLQSNDKAAGNSSQLKTHLADLTLKNTFKEAPSARKQEELERKANYSIVKKDIQKWQGIIKKNREAPHLDLTQKTDDKISVNNNRRGITKTALEEKLDNKLKELKLYQESDILNEEKEMLKRLNPDEAKKRETELAKFKNLMFYKELKNKRVSKIKSRLYHKIKKKRELKMQQKLLESGDLNDPALQLKEIEDLEKQRAEERIGMRHKNKSKFAKNVLRYANEKDAKQSVNDLAQFRKELMKKINASQKEALEEQMQHEEGDEGLDDQQFRDKLIEEVEEQLKNGDDEEEEQPKDGKKKKLPGFMQRLKEQQKRASRREAEELLEKLKSTDNLDDFEMSEEDQAKDAEDEDGEDKTEKKEKKNEKKKDDAFGGRKKFHKDTANPTVIEVQEYKKEQKPLKTQDILKSYINNQDDQAQIGVSAGINEDKGSNQKLKSEGKTTHFDRLEPKDLGIFQEEKKAERDSSAKKGNKKSESKGKDESSVMEVEKAANNQDGDEGRTQKGKNAGKKSKNSSANKDDLVSGLNFGGLKEKYSKGPNNQFLNDEIEKFNEENKQDIYNDLSNFQIVNSNIYNEDFAQEKQKLLEDELPPEPKGLKGWGTWTGLGIKEKKVDPQVQLQQKVKRINELQKKRQDGKLENVIIDESRNKSVTKYLVRDLPHPYRSTEQFDFIQGVALGPEVNTMKNYQRLNKSKVITKAGEIINPIKMAKKPGKQQVN